MSTSCTSDIMKACVLLLDNVKYIPMDSHVTGIYLEITGPKTYSFGSSTDSSGAVSNQDKSVLKVSSFIPCALFYCKQNISMNLNYHMALRRVKLVQTDKCALIPLC